MAATLDVSEISEFFDNKSVFITGATGFIGKVLLEKLLYSCSGIQFVYVLIRQKKNKSGSESGCRFEELLKSKVFDRIRTECPHALHKIVPVWGDLTHSALGISSESVKDILENVSIVMHCAATVKFNEPLKVATEINFVGTKNVMNLFKKLKSQQAFVHLSTAYANCHRDQIDEIVYPSPVPPTFLLQASENFKEKEMDFLTDIISEGRPNTYTITKAITEAYIEENASGLPVAVVRPSMVASSVKDPKPGWGDSFSTLARIVYVVGLGLVRNLPVNGQARADIIPVDMVCNLMIAVAWFTSKNRSKNNTVPVYNFVSGAKNPLTYKGFLDAGLNNTKERPLLFTVNYPNLSFSRNPVLLYFGIYLNHYLPALILDFLRLFKGKRSKYFKLYHRFYSTLHFKTFFLQREFNFQFENCPSLYQILSTRDKEIFNFDISSFDWQIYLDDMFEELKDFYYPNEKKDYVKARKRLYWLYIRSVTVDVVYCLGIPLLIYFTVLSPLYKNFGNDL